MSKLSIIAFLIGLSFISISFSSQLQGQQPTKECADDWQLVATPKSLKSVVIKALAHDNAQLKRELNSSQVAARGLRNSLAQVARASQANADQVLVEQKRNGETQRMLRFHQKKHTVFKQNMTHMYQCASAARQQLLTQLEQEKIAHANTQTILQVSQSRLNRSKQKTAVLKAGCVFTRLRANAYKFQLAIITRQKADLEAELQHVQSDRKQLNAKIATAQQKVDAIAADIAQLRVLQQKEKLDYDVAIKVQCDDLINLSCVLDQARASKAQSEKQLQNQFAVSQTAQAVAMSAEKEHANRIQAQLQKAKADKAAIEQQLKSKLEIMQVAHAAFSAKAQADHATTTQTLQKTAAELAAEKAKVVELTAQLATAQISVNKYAKLKASFITHYDWVYKNRGGTGAKNHAILTALHNIYMVQPVGTKLVLGMCNDAAHASATMGCLTHPT